MAKLHGWKKELNARREKKLAEARTAQEKKDKLTEQVRQHLGYQAGPKDPKFEELYDKFEKEAKKTEKEARKLKRQAITAERQKNPVVKASQSENVESSS